MGCEGDTVVRTPNLDRLAAGGMLFESCYCPSPICVPSRMSFMTARYPHHNEVWTNGCMLRSDIPTFAHALGAAGYETVLGGRMHFVGLDQRHGFESRLVGPLCSPHLGGRNRAITSELYPGAGQSRPAVEIAGPGRTGYQAYDEAVVDASVEFLRRRAASADRPLCLVVGLVMPHCPFICPEDDFDYYMERVTLPDIPDGYFEALHPAMQLWRENRDLDGLSDEQIRRARAGYYGLVTHADGQVGRLLRALDEGGLTENTAVIYTSDHGEGAGEHGLWWKSNFYEPSASVPLIASWPGHIAEGSRAPHVTNLVDLGPTLIDLAGREALPGVDGRSLGPALRSESTDWPDETFSEHHPSQGVPAARMVRSGPWKLTHFEGYRPQLFNIEDDPGEWRDLGQEPEYAEVRRRLLGRVLDGWSAEHMVSTLAERAKTNRVLSAWCRRVKPDCPDQYVAPPEANVYRILSD